MGTIKINGMIFHGSSINITDDDIVGGNKIIIDGIDVTKKLGDNYVQNNTIKIEVTGDIEHLETTKSVTVNGNVGRDIKSRGSVHVTGNVDGYVDADGSVHVGGNVGGYVDCSGSVKAGSVGGQIKAGGSVNIR